jgi:hypothetical protein
VTSYGYEAAASPVGFEVVLAGDGPVGVQAGVDVGQVLQLRIRVAPLRSSFASGGALGVVRLCGGSG